MTPRKVCCADRSLPGSPYMSDTHIIDPLAEDTPPTNEQHAATSAGELTVPDVRGLPATQAIEAVREHGLIAAVRSAPAEHDGEEGLVLDQDPHAGNTIAREAILTLTIAEPTPQPTVVAQEAEAPPADMEVGETTESEDDTEEWFTALREQTHASSDGSSQPAPDPDGDEEPAFDPDLDLDSVLAGAASQRLDIGGLLAPLRAALGVGIASWRSWRWRTPATVAVCVLLGMLAAHAVDSHTNRPVTASVTPAHTQEPPGSTAVAPRHVRRPHRRHTARSPRGRAAAARAPATPQTQVPTRERPPPPPPPVQVSAPPLAPAPPAHGAVAELGFER
jgi:PASTA domain